MKTVNLPTRPGQRIRAKDMESVRDELHRSRLNTGTTGLNFRATSVGTAISFNDPLRTMWVFVVGFDGGQPIVKEAAPTSLVGVLVPSGPALRPPVLHGYTAAHFEQFMVVDFATTPESHVCVIEGGYLIPHYRFLVIEPPDVEELCEPCESAAQASSCEGCPESAPCAECSS